MYSLLNKQIKQIYIYIYILIIHDKYRICVINMYINIDNTFWK